MFVWTHKNKVLFLFRCYVFHAVNDFLNLNLFFFSKNAIFPQSSQKYFPYTKFIDGLFRNFAYKILLLVGTREADIFKKF